MTDGFEIVGYEVRFMVHSPYVDHLFRCSLSGPPFQISDFFSEPALQISDSMSGPPLKGQDGIGGPPH